MKDKVETWIGGYDERPEWDILFLTQAFLIAQRSIDNSCVHGAILVSKQNRILSVGYNGGIAGFDDAKIPMERPFKYPYLLHAEENCILNYNSSLRDLEDSTMYVTGTPCHKCLRMILQKGIRKVVYGGVTASMIDENEIKICKEITEGVEGASVRYIGDEYKDEVLSLLKRTKSYISHRG
jgi:dCMP deaminase